MTRVKSNITVGMDLDLIVELEKLAKKREETRAKIVNRACRLAVDLGLENLDEIEVEAMKRDLPLWEYIFNALDAYSKKPIDSVKPA